MIEALNFTLKVRMFAHIKIIIIFFSEILKYMSQMNKITKYCRTTVEFEIFFALRII